MSTPKQKISALIITYNEIGYIEKCIDSVSFADEIIVVDSYSNDGTYEYLKEHPKVRVIQHPFKNFTAQKAFTLNQASNDWVLFLDADEIVSEELQNEIVNTINSDKKHVAYWFYKKFMFQDRRLFFSGWQTDKNYRLFRKSKVAFCEKRIVHETLNIEGSSGVFRKKLIHFCYKDYTTYKRKILSYGRLKAKEVFERNSNFSYSLFLLKPVWKFFHSYILRLGILDGKKGLIVCSLDALCYVEVYRELQKLEREEKWSAVFRTMP